MFKRLGELELNESVAFSYLFRGYEAVDIDNRICLSTTNGRTRNARRWFVNCIASDGKINYNAGKVTFRAWTLSEALERVNEPKLAHRIADLIDRNNHDPHHPSQP